MKVPNALGPFPVSTVPVTFERRRVDPGEGVVEPIGDIDIFAVWARLDAFRVFAAWDFSQMPVGCRVENGHVPAYWFVTNALPAASATA